MTVTENAPDIDISDKVGQTMSYITFGKLVHELLGSPFEEVYKDHLLQGDKDE